MSVAIIGLVGVLIGAIITAGSNYLVADRRERADRERESRNRAIEIRRASRLIDADLVRAQAACVMMIDKRHWWPDDVSPLTLEGWQQYRGVIAPEVSYAAWSALMVAVEAVDIVMTSRSIATETGLTEIDDSLAEKIASNLHDIKAGRAALAPLMLDPPESERDP